jgi:hypothetical protein
MEAEIQFKTLHPKVSVIFEHVHLKVVDQIVVSIDEDKNITN